jgi:hypothetical protein
LGESNDERLREILARVVIAGLGPAIHEFFAHRKPWMRGTSPRMTLFYVNRAE